MCKWIRREAPPSRQTTPLGFDAALKHAGRTSGWRDGAKRRARHLRLFREDADCGGRWQGLMVPQFAPAVPALLLVHRGGLVAPGPSSCQLVLVHQEGQHNGRHRRSLAQLFGQLAFLRRHVHPWRSASTSSRLGLDRERIPKKLHGKLDARHPPNPEHRRPGRNRHPL